MHARFPRVDNLILDDEYNQCGTRCHRPPYLDRSSSLRLETVDPAERKIPELATQSRADSSRWRTHNRPTVLQSFPFLSFIYLVE